MQDKQSVQDKLCTNLPCMLPGFFNAQRQPELPALLHTCGWRALCVVCSLGVQPNKASVVSRQ